MPSTAEVPVSFELYPARTDAGIPALYETVERLAAIDPAFISVTYGAGGSTRDRSLALLRHILSTTRVEPMAHLTCVGTSYVEATALIREFLDAGITRFLALRGDPPEGVAEDEDFLGDIRSAAELAQLIDRVQAERVPYGEAPVPGLPQAARVVDPHDVQIAVAAFPNGHPRSRHSREHIDALLAKEAAGATLAITQLFFYADDYLSFVERSRAAGVTIPILPGIMPIISPKRLQRAVALDVEPTPEGQRAVGIEHASKLVRAVVAGGAPGVHLYAFNNHRTVLDVLDAAGFALAR
jgi:methylenetetrahydrofolate reductase (NADPH)